MLSVLGLRAIMFPLLTTAALILLLHSTPTSAGLVRANDRPLSEREPSEREPKSEEMEGYNLRNEVGSVVEPAMESAGNYVSSQFDKMKRIGSSQFDKVKKVASGLTGIDMPTNNPRSRWRVFRDQPVEKYTHTVCVLGTKSDECKNTCTLSTTGSETEVNSWRLPPPQN